MVCYKSHGTMMCHIDDGVFPFRSAAVGGSYAMKGKAPFLFVDDDVLLLVPIWDLRQEGIFLEV